MSSPSNQIVFQDLGSLDADKLREVGRDLQLFVQLRDKEIDTLREQVKALKNNPGRQADTDEIEITRTKGQQRLEEEEFFGPWSSPRWIRAEHDDPDDTTMFCFRRKTPEVVVYDFRDDAFEIASVKALLTESAIITRLPTRISKKLYVYVESASDRGSTSNPRVQITTKPRTPKGFMFHSAINLQQLSTPVKLSIITGRIKWLFILGYPGDSRASTGESAYLKNKKKRCQ